MEAVLIGEEAVASSNLQFKGRVDDVPCQLEAGNDCTGSSADMKNVVDDINKPPVEESVGGASSKICVEELRLVNNRIVNVDSSSSSSSSRAGKFEHVYNNNLARGSPPAFRLGDGDVDSHMLSRIRQQLAGASSERLNYINRRSHQNLEAFSQRLRAAGDNSINMNAPALSSSSFLSAMKGENQETPPDFVSGQDCQENKLDNSKSPIPGNSSHKGHGDGISLREFLRSSYGKRERRHGLSLFRQLVELVDSAHSQGLFLMDLRPSLFALVPSKKLRYTGTFGKNNGDEEVNRKRPGTQESSVMGRDLKKRKMDLEAPSTGRPFERISPVIDLNVVDAYNPDSCELQQQNYRKSLGVASMTRRKQSMSTWLEEQWYTCPEEINGEDSGEKSNIYALGVLLFELLCHCESSEMHAAMMADLRHRILPPAFLSKYPEEAGFCLWLLHPEPSSRPTAREILNSELISKNDSAISTAADEEMSEPKQPRDRDGDRKLGRERGPETSNLKFVDTETFPERLLLCPSPYPTILDVPGSPHTYWGRFLCVPETSPSPRRTRYVRRHQVGVPVQPRSELLLHFLSSLEKQKKKNATKLLQDIQTLEDDIKEAEQRYSSNASLVRSHGAIETRVQSSPLDERCTTSSGALFAPTANTDRLMMSNIRQLEDAYFFMRSQMKLSNSASRSDKSLLKDRWSENQNENQETKTKGKSSDQVEVFFEGVCKFARYSKFETCGTIRSGDLLNSTASVVCSLSFDAEEEHIAAAGISKKIKIFDFNAFMNESVGVQYPLVEMVSKSKLSCVCWNSYIKNYLASTDYDGVVQIWDAGTGQGFSQYTEHQKRAWSVDFSPSDPTKFVSGSDDCSVKLWSVNEKRSLGTIWSPANVCCVQFSAYSNHLLAFGSADYKVYCYDLRYVKTPWCTLAGHEKTVSYVKFMDSETIVSASTDNSLKLWNLNKTGLSPGACPLTYKGHTNQKNFAGLSVLDGYIACGSETNEVYSYYKSLPMPMTSYKFGSVDPISGNECFDDNGQFVSSVCWRKKSNMLVAANSTGNMTLLKLV